MGNCRVARGPLQGQLMGLVSISSPGHSCCVSAEAGVTGLDLQANNPTPSHAAMQSGDTGGRHGHHSLLKLGDLNSKYKK